MLNAFPLLAFNAVAFVQENRRGDHADFVKEAQRLAAHFRVLGIVYAVYIISYFTGVVSGAEAGPETAGAVIAGTLVAPHAVCAGVAAIFNALAWALSSRPFALTSGILYAVSMVLFPMYFMFVIIQTVLSFVGFARLPKTA